MRARGPVTAPRPVILLFLLAFSCAGAKPPFQFKGPEPHSAGDRAMARLSEQIIDDLLRADPIHASYVGYRRWDGLLPDWSPEGLARTTAMVKRYQGEVARLAGSKLSPAFEIDRQLLAEALDQELFVLTELHPETWDVQVYNEVIGSGFYDLTLPPEDPAKWPARLEAIVSRMSALPRFLEVAKKTLKTPPRAFTEFVIAQSPGNVETIEKTLPPLFEAHPALRARFEAERPKVVRALADWQTFLEKELLPRSTGDYRLGKALWEKKLRLTLQSSMTADEVYQRAAHGLEVTRFEMYDLALPIFRAAWPDDRRYLELAGDERIDYVVKKVLDEAAKEHGTPESIFADVKGYAETIKAFITKSDLITLPPATDRFVIEPTPSYLDGLAVAFYNPAPAFEPDLKKSFWISSVPKTGADAESFLKEYNRYTLQALTIHEAFPGHYVQLYHSSHSPYASIVKQVFESGTMAEGWACMIEQLVHEAGYSKDDPKNRLFHLKMRLRLFINAMIDQRLHTSTGPAEADEKWALELLTTKGFQEEAEATRKLRRAKLTSTQLSTYFVGYAEMLDLYRAGEKKGGATFARKAFLEKMVSFGTIPPRAIRKMLESEGAI